MSRYLLFVTVNLALLLSSISETGVAVAFPVITSSFNTSLVQAGWVLSIYQLMYTATMPLAGKVSEIFGKKVAFLAAVILFTTGSMLCAIAPNIHLLIVFRAIQAIGGSAFYPIAGGIAAEVFPKRRQQFIGFFSAIYPIGQIIGPTIGGWLVSSYGWESIFWFNVPLGAIVFAISAYMLKSGTREKGHIDILGAGLFIGSLFALLNGLSQLGNNENGVPWVPGLLLVVSIALMIFFLRHISRAKDPIIDFQILKEKPFLAANIYNLIYGICVLGVMSFIPLYAVSVYNMTTLQSGFVITPRSIGAMLASTVVSLFLVRWGYRRPLIVGASLSIVTLFLLGMEFQGGNLIGLQLSSTVIIFLIMFLSGIATGTANPASNNACIELMPERVTSIIGVRGMFRMTGASISVAITTLLLHKVGDMAAGFNIVFFAMVVVMLVTLPLIFAMPKGPEKCNE